MIRILFDDDFFGTGYIFLLVSGFALAVVYWWLKKNYIKN
jgi:hypothetical protein